MRGQEEAERGEVAEEEEEEEDEVTRAVAPKISAPPVAAPKEEEHEVGSPLFKVKVLDTLFVRRELPLLVLFWMLLEGKGAESGESDGLELLC